MQMRPSVRTLFPLLLSDPWATSPRAGTGPCPSRASQSPALALAPYIAGSTSERQVSIGSTRSVRELDVAGLEDARALNLPARYGVLRAKKQTLQAPRALGTRARAPGAR